jgi:GntR family transcriptional regulator
MRLKRKAPIPLYIQLKDSLVADIGNGNYQPHQQMPSERELCERFKVSRMTVRQALTEMVRDGLVYAVVGKGTFVSEPKINQELRSLTGFSQDAQARGNKPTSRVLEAQVIPATSHLAQMLNMAPGDEIVMLSRLRLSNDVPLAIETSHLPYALCPQLLQHDFASESLYHVLESEYGLRLVRAEQTIEAGLADPPELELLQMLPPAAVLRMERRTYTDQDVPVEYVVSAYRSDRYKFRSVLQECP